MADLLIENTDFGSLTTELLGQGHTVRFRVHGNSMRPFIFDGDLVEVERVAPANLQTGDVVFCRLRNDMLVVHRIIGTSEGDLLIKGDALRSSDGIVPREDVIGVVNAVIRRGKRIALRNAWTKITVKFWGACTPLRYLLSYTRSAIYRLLARGVRPTD